MRTVHGDDATTGGGRDPIAWFVTDLLDCLEVRPPTSPRYDLREMRAERGAAACRERGG